MLGTKLPDGGYLITAVDHPLSFWTELEKRTGLKLTPEQRVTLRKVLDGPVVVDRAAGPIKLGRGWVEPLTATGYRLREQMTFSTNDPRIFTRRNFS